MRLPEPITRLKSGQKRVCEVPNVNSHIPKILAVVLVLVTVIYPVSAGNVNKTYMVSFAGEPVELAGFDETIRMWFALFTLLFVAMFAGASHAPQIAVVDMALAWIFTGIGWLDPLTESVVANVGVYGQSALVSLLMLATFYVIVWNFREGKRKEKGT